MATILIVDDLSANRNFLATLLRDQGHRVVEAPDGRGGLAAVQAEHPDLVITDVLMPVMDGYEFVRQLRLDPATSALPVLFYTAPYSEREARALALASGVSWVLPKPSEAEEVLKIVHRVLSGESDATMPSDGSPHAIAFDREYLRLHAGQLSEHVGDLRAANARLRALINIGLELAPERNLDHLLHKLCVAVRDLFGATYVTTGIVDPDAATVQRVLSCGADASGRVGAPSWFGSGSATPGILGTVVSERRAIRGVNPGGDPARLELSALHPDVHAFLAVPIVSPAHVYGWICLVRDESTAFTEDDEHLVTALAAQAGRIYENLSFSAGAVTRAEELRREVLERQQAERVANRERDRAQGYLDTAEVILLKLDRDGKIRLVNRYACALLGWTAGELVGRDWIDTCVPARTRDALRPRLDELMTGDLSVHENLILTRSGAERLIEWRNRLIRDDDGHVIGAFSSGTDVTERHEAIEALRAAEERVRYALDAAGVGIWDMDYTTGVIQWSETLEAQYGLQPGTFGGTFDAFVERIHPEDRAAVAGTIADAMTRGSDFSLQYRSIWPDGTVHSLTGAGRILLGEHGEAVRGVGIAQDVTERRMLEQQYQQAQKMEAVGRLAGGVAHDFNNLLTVILGFSEMLLTELGPDDPRRADVAEIHSAGARGAALTRQLLAFSRNQIIEPTLLDLNVVVADLRAMLGRLIEEDVKVVLRLRPEPACVTADRAQVEQIVMNLAMNARDAMPRGGTLTIETAHACLGQHDATTLSSVKPVSHIALRVIDTGTGMTPEVQARLFEPFFTTKEVGKGTGLGLATVYGIVGRSGGSVDVRSAVGEGTSVTVYFPAADAAGLAGDTPTPVAREHAGGQTVLVVEDEEALGEVTRRLLERQGYTVLLAGSAVEARRLFDRNSTIDVLLTDVVMPGTSGPELTRELAERRPGLRVLYMSGYTDDAIVRHGVLNPGISLLNKPFTSEALGRKMREVVDR